jgi:hypothetical protein
MIWQVAGDGEQVPAIRKATTKTTEGMGFKITFAVSPQRT